ncbi:hypothetical protein AB205_0136540 [Aquarana catesbeiana]|uniref:Uncharacterized protein n=1 Tax=Aquarana catesbeiana TaxID=8400 RepID=A0A2G9R5Y6_AQUCT|nr:hypothetical protein AB205_0136540 [Aquarana catesbeiana]
MFNKHGHSFSPQLSVDTLTFLLFLYIQQINKVSLRTSLIGEEWPSPRARSPSPDLAGQSNFHKESCRQLICATCQYHLPVPTVPPISAHSATYQYIAADHCYLPVAISAALSAPISAHQSSLISAYQ